jgi:hypothetical protein
MKIKIETCYVLCSFLALFSFYINMVFRTTILLESVLLLNIFVFLNQRKKFSSINGNSMAAVVLAALSLLLILISIFREMKIDNELYRLLFLPVLYFSFSLIKLNYAILLRRLFWVSAIGAAYNVFDVIYFNIFLAGDISNHYGAAALSSLEDTQYDGLVSFFGLFPYFRPFGIFGQPQKSAFISSIGIVLYYFVTRLDGKSIRNSRSYLIFFGFFISGVVTGGTTGILASLILLLIIYASEYGLFVFGTFALAGASAIFTAVYFVINHPLYFNALAKDINGLFNNGALNFVFGSGFVSSDDLFKRGFGVEHFIFRVIFEIGLLPFLIWSALLVLSIFRNGYSKAGLLIAVLLIFLTAHYSVTNVYFVAMLLCFFLCASSQVRTVKI